MINKLKKKINFVAVAFGIFMNIFCENIVLLAFYYCYLFYNGFNYWLDWKLWLLFELGI